MIKRLFANYSHKKSKIGKIKQKAEVVKKSQLNNFKGGRKTSGTSHLTDSLIDRL